MGGVETLHSSVDIPAALCDVGRLVKFHLGVFVESTDGSDTWQIRVRLGGLTGTLLWAGNNVDTSAYALGVVSGWFWVQGLGAGDAIMAGGASGYGEAIASVSGATINKIGLKTDGNTDTGVTLAVTSESSGTSAGEGVEIGWLRAWVEPGVGTVTTPLP